MCMFHESVHVNSLSRVFDGFVLSQSHSAHSQSFLEDLSEAQCTSPVLLLLMVIYFMVVIISVSDKVLRMVPLLR